MSVIALLDSEKKEADEREERFREQVHNQGVIELTKEQEEKQPKEEEEEEEVEEKDEEYVINDEEYGEERGETEEGEIKLNSSRVPSKKIEDRQENRSPRGDIKVVRAQDYPYHPPFGVNNHSVGAFRTAIPSHIGGERLHSVYKANPRRALCKKCGDNDHSEAQCLSFKIEMCPLGGSCAFKRTCAFVHNNERRRNPRRPSCWGIYCERDNKSTYVVTVGCGSNDHNRNNCPFASCPRCCGNHGVYACPHKKREETQKDNGNNNNNDNDFEADGIYY